ncbi:MAG: SURF1 family protein [Actinomycetota bacterium]|nr:SURF1 family protein [Actinomycetota bacterium]
MYRFLLQRRWVALHAVVLLLAPLCVTLGNWQWDRHEARTARARQIEHNSSQPPVPLRELLTGRPALPVAAEWRTVVIEGRYSPAATVLLRNRGGPDGGTGFGVLVPLLTREGAVLVDRGWVPRTGTSDPDVPPPPSGRVTVTGYLRPGGVRARDAGVDRSRARPSVARIDLAALSDLTGRALAPAYVQLVGEAPAPAARPRVLPLPDESSWRNISYAFQWYLFAGLAVVGWVLLVRREILDRRNEPAPRARAAEREPV